MTFRTPPKHQIQSGRGIPIRLSAPAVAAGHPMGSEVARSVRLYELWRARLIFESARASTTQGQGWDEVPVKLVEGNYAARPDPGPRPRAARPRHLDTVCPHRNC